MRELIVFGRASQKIIKTISIGPNDLSLNLMEVLLAHGIPVASSCNGEGVCLKCILTANGEKVLSCQTDISDILKDQPSATVIFSYL